MTDMDTGNYTPLPPIPDNMTIAQFMLDFEHEMRPPLVEKKPCFVDSKSGRELTISQVRSGDLRLFSC
jgi:hypothetical protein